MLPKSYLLLQELRDHLVRSREVPSVFVEICHEVLLAFRVQLLGYQQTILAKSTLGTHDLFDCPIGAVQRTQNPTKPLR